MKTFFLILLFLTIIIPNAAAHPFTEETNPSSTTNAPEGITQIVVNFSEQVEINFSVLKVFDSTGEQIDNRDTKYYKNEKSLVVSTPPLADGVYTVTSKVLSKVDGHLVDGAFNFGVGNAIVIQQESQAGELVFLPEAAARFPGLVGQTIVLGAVFASLLIWRTQSKQLIKPELSKLESILHGRFMSLTGIGLVLVFASNILMLSVQAIRLEVSALDAMQTSFGNIWLFRMAITIILLGIWFGLDRKKILTFKNQIPILAVALVLIFTSSLIGHGAASEQPSAISLDYVHNFVASVWIGGLIYFVFVLLSGFSKLDEIKREKMTLVLIPRFSIAFIISIGIVIISGPTLLWFLETDVSLITSSIYGQLIFLKIAIASIMVAFGGYFQFKIQKNAEKNLQNGPWELHKNLQKKLKYDIILGVVLLGVVSLLINGTLPAGEIQRAEAVKILYGFKTIEFSDTIQYDVEINPLASGVNTILVKISDLQDRPLENSDSVKVKISNPQKNISPIIIPLNEISQEKELIKQFQGEVTFGFSGQWQMEIEVQRSQHANESISMTLFVKPKLPDIKTQILEYPFPETSGPLYPLYDDNSIWISDASAPRLWNFSIETLEFTSYSFEGKASMLLTKDKEGKIWFTDSPSSQIGFFDPTSKQITTISVPEIGPEISENVMSFIQADFKGDIWIAIINKDAILKYHPEANSFDIFKLPKPKSMPFALAIDSDGKIWFTEAGTGMIGFINPGTNEIKEFLPDQPLLSPEALFFDDDGNLWISEHTGAAISKFNPILETFEKIPLLDKEGLPYGMANDRYGNIWIAQHTIDKIAVYDPYNGNLIEIPVPTSTSFVQFLASDDKDNVWFVEQRGNKLGMIQITERVSGTSKIGGGDYFNVKYSEIVSPLIAMGIIATSLFFIKSVKDKRKLNLLINS